MKTFIFKLAIVLLLLWTHAHRNQSTATEILEVYPIQVECDKKAVIGLSSLVSTEKYTVTIDCGSLNCAENFEQRKYQIENKSFFSIEEEFNIDSSCTQDTTQSTASIKLEPADSDELITKIHAPSGRYTVRLYAGATNKVLAEKNFYLISPLSKSCEVQTKRLGLQNTTHPLTIFTKVACVYNISIINPVGKRVMLLSQFISPASPLKYSIEAAHLNEFGVYKIVAIADNVCSSDLDRECSAATFKVVNLSTNAQKISGCAYNKADSGANCLQCSDGLICKATNQCEPDSASACAVKTESKQLATPPTDPATNKIISALNTNGTGVIVVVITPVLFTILIFFIIKITRDKKSKIETDKSTGTKVP